MRFLLVIIFICLNVLLSGCANDAYYESLTAQFDARVKGYELELARLEKQKSIPLVDHSWIDIEGNRHTLVVNQPAGHNQPKQHKPFFKVPAPWEIWFNVFDRTLSFGERMLPGYLSYRAASDRNDSDTTFNLGDGNNFQLTSGDYSPADMLLDNSRVDTVITTSGMP